MNTEKKNNWSILKGGIYIVTKYILYILVYEAGRVSPFLDSTADIITLSRCETTKVAEKVYATRVYVENMVNVL